MAEKILIYCGKNNRYRNRYALVRDHPTNKSIVLAQFNFIPNTPKDKMDPGFFPECFGWHEFPRRDFTLSQAQLDASDPHN